MRIALIGHGGLPIPPPGWGAVEGVIWRRAQRLRHLGHTVDIYNTKRIDQVIGAINHGHYDFVDCHNDGFAGALNTGLRHPYVLTNHHGDLHRLTTRLRVDKSYRARLNGCLGAPGNIALSDRIRRFYLDHGYKGFLKTLPNTVAVADFRFEPLGRRGAICIGKIANRKRQASLAEMTSGKVPIDFVGPWRRERVPEFKENLTATYLGQWNHDMIEQRLTEYRCLVLLSRTEAAPLVVIEALAAGLSVVVSEAAAANLSDEEFITVLPVEETRPTVIVGAIQSAIDNNRRLRASIRDYAREHFDEAVGTQNYLEVIDEFRALTELSAEFFNEREAEPAE